MIGPPTVPPKRFVVQSRVLVDATPLVGFVDRVEVTVCEVLVQGAMQLVRAALDDSVELAASGASELCAVLVLKEGEFGNGLVRHVDDPPGNSLVVVIDALHHEIVVPGPLAADRRALAEASASARGDAGSLQREVEHP